MTTEADRLALVSWSAIAEPGDAIAHALVGVLGPREALDWARSAVSDPIGASLDLSASFNSGETAGRDLVDRAIAAVGRWGQRATAWDPTPHLERAEKVGARVVVRGDPEWPSGLDDLGGAAPYCLWVRGSADVGAAWGRSVAIVGSRSSTAYGEYVAAMLAGDLVAKGHAVVSGGAYGIDARAHRGALAAGGVTVAVMAGGVDRLYPAGNTDLLERVIETGAIVGELPPGYAPHRSRFLTRNRIIAAAKATVVVEAAHRSGALSTAFHAAGIGRVVAAVPGCVTSAASGGCHRLIRDGAVLVTGASDIVDLIEPLDASRNPPLRDAAQGDAGAGGRRRQDARAPLDFASAEHRQAYDALSRRGSTIGEVAKTAGLGLAEARSALGGLELKGMVLKDGAVWRRAPMRT